MNVAVIGAGGRESAIAWKLRQSSRVRKVFVLPGNDGIQESRPVQVNDFPGIMTFCRENEVSLVVVGPELPLIEGIVDAFVSSQKLAGNAEGAKRPTAGDEGCEVRAQNLAPLLHPEGGRVPPFIEKLHAFADSGIRVLGPTAHAARLEGSKCFAKEFMEKYDVATARYFQCKNLQEAEKAISELGVNVVLKFDGLAGGKGVFVCSTPEEIRKSFAAFSQAFGADSSLVVEERLIGDEVSIIGFTNGREISLLLPSQDHKQLYDGDKGPNTGGMGAFCPVPWLTDERMQEIFASVIQPTLRGFEAENMVYRGPIYFGLMITKDGPKLLEYNVRLGDPETQILLPALKSDLVDLIESCFSSEMNANIEFVEGFTVGVVLATQDYPKSGATGIQITGLENVTPPTQVFHSAVKKIGNDFFTNGGRIMTVVGQGPSLSQVREKVYGECNKINFTGKQFRSDIGNRNRIVNPKP